jgi:hypothetical protein
MAMILAIQAATEEQLQNECQAPLVPDEVDLTDYKFMPLEVARLLQSEWWIVACAEDPRRAIAAVNLWARSWHQRPAASLPDNDVVLSTMAMVPLAVWREIRDAVMEAWVLCSDGRWYHPVVAEKAVEAWHKKRDYAERSEQFGETQRARAKKGWKKRRGNAGSDAGAMPDECRGSAGAMPDECRGSAGAMPDECRGSAGAMPDECRGNAGAMPNESPLNANEIERDSKSKRDSNSKGNFVPKEEELLSPAGAVDVTKSALKGEGYTQEFEVWWSIYPRKDSKRTAFLAFQRAKTRVPVDRITDGARAYAARRKGEDPQFTKLPTTWLNGDCWNDEAPPGKPKPKWPGYVPQAANGG